MSQKLDRFFRIKYVAYCQSQLPPEGVDITFEDFVNHAKFQLSVDKCVLLEDPIWQKYTDEMILVEYYGNLYSKSKDARNSFEALLRGEDTSLHNWFDDQIAKNQEELKAKAEKFEDKIEFVPETVGGD